MIAWLDANGGADGRTSDSLFILRGSLLNMAGLALRMAVSPLMLFVPRFFQQDVFGVFVALRSLISVSQKILGLGLAQGLVWWIPGRAGDDGLINGAVRGIVVFTTLTSLVGSMFLFAGLLLFRDLLPEILKSAPPVFLCVCLLSIPGITALTTACGCMDGIRKPEYRAFFAQSLSVGLIPILIFTLHFLGIPDSLAWSLFLANWLCAAFVLWRVWESFPAARRETRIVPDRNLLGYSLGQSLGEWVAAALSNIDFWLVAFMLGSSESAVYGVMLMLARGVSAVRRSYEPLIVPVVSGMRPEMIAKKLPEVLAYVTHMICSKQLAVALFLACFQRELLSISGPQYAGHPMIFLVLLSSNLVAGLQSATSQSLLGMGEVSAVLKVRAALLVLAVASGIPLVWNYGMAGAALTSLLTGIAGSLTLLVLQSRICGKWIYRKKFFLDAALQGVFIFAAWWAEECFPDSGFLSRVNVFLLAAALFGAVAFIARRTFIPPK